MTIMIAAAMMMSATTPATDTKIDHHDWTDVVAAARRADMSPIVLYRALTAPASETAPRHATRLCLRRDDVVAGKAGMVCRTRYQWASLGVEFTPRKG